MTGGRDVGCMKSERATAHSQAQLFSVWSCLGGAGEGGQRAGISLAADVDIPRHTTLGLACLAACVQRAWVPAGSRNRRDRRVGCGLQLVTCRPGRDSSSSSSPPCFAIFKSRPGSLYSGHVSLPTTSLVSPATCGRDKKLDHPSMHDVTGGPLKDLFFSEKLARQVEAKKENSLVMSQLACTTCAEIVPSQPKAHMRELPWRPYSCLQPRFHHQPASQPSKLIKTNLETAFAGLG